MRRLLTVGAVLLGLGVLLAGAGFFWIHRTHPDSPGVEPVEVPRGASLRSVARALTDRGLLDSPWQLRLAARWKGGAEAIKAGSYEFERELSAVQLLAKLVEGAVATVAVTLPEGWTARQMVRVLADSLSVEEEVLRQLVREPRARWRERFAIPDGHGLEGYLFPETYRFARSADPEQILEGLLSELAETLDAEAHDRRKEVGLSVHELLTLASIVEAETRVRAEGPQIAAVYLNRIEAGWNLEADPTIAYALDKQGETITYADLEIDSPYNTYRFPGLPPGPINNPGSGSIRSVLWPAEDFDAMYFVADGTGRHTFSRTWQEHKKAVQAYRQWRRDARTEAGG